MRTTPALKIKVFLYWLLFWKSYRLPFKLFTPVDGKYGGEDGEMSLKGTV